MNNIPYIHDPKLHNGQSAKIVVPILVDLFNPTSVIDVGCGLGDWLSFFEKNGITNTLGIDGKWVDKSKLYIDEKNFIETDLTQTFKLNKVFDLAISLEVAEHLPETAADSFIDTLTSLSNQIVFSAAIPAQGGQNHINEQWHSYWISKFESRGFRCYDCIRPLIWGNIHVAWWYQQNMYFFSKGSLSFNYEEKVHLQNAVHPDLWTKQQEELAQLKAFLKSPKNLFKLLIRRILNDENIDK